MYEKWMKEGFYRFGPKSNIKNKKDQALTSFLRNDLFFNGDGQMQEKENEIHEKLVLIDVKNQS